MSNYDPNYQPVRYGAAGVDRAIEIDQGLRAYMISVYNYMAIGVALTGVVSWLTYQMAVVEQAGRVVSLTAFGQAIFNPITMIVLLLGTLGLVLFISFRIERLHPSTALTLFLVYAGLLGLALAPIFLQYTGASITRTFFISAASFGALSLYGYTTQRDLSAFGAFLVIGLIGLVLAVLVEMGLALFGIRSAAFSFIISVIGVLVFAGLTAWDTQKIKEMYDANDDGTITGRKAIMGALTLYLDFINLFLFMLRLIGDRR